MNIYEICCCKKLGEHYWAWLKHDFSISTEFSYQIPLNQGFPDHYFELKELQSIMQNFSHEFHSLRFLLNKTSNIYHSFQLLILGSPIKASRVTTSNSENFKVLCNVSLTNFVPCASNRIRHKIIYIIHIKSLYQNPPDHGFQGHYFKLRELQGIINISLTNFVPSTSKIYHSYQILISDSPRSRLLGSLLQTQGTSRYYAIFLSRISFLPLPIKLDMDKSFTTTTNIFMHGNC